MSEPNTPESTVNPVATPSPTLFQVCKEHVDDIGRLAMGVWNELLVAWSSRTRKLGKYTASHPVLLRELVAGLDARGEVEAADAIHSLVWELALQRQRDMRDMLNSIEMGIYFRTQDEKAAAETKKEKA